MVIQIHHNMYREIRKRMYVCKCIYSTRERVFIMKLLLRVYVTYIKHTKIMSEI